jgi:hypothetical protein
MNPPSPAPASPHQPCTRCRLEDAFLSSQDGLPDPQTFTRQFNAFIHQAIEACSSREQAHRIQDLLSLLAHDIANHQATLLLLLETIDDPDRRP